MQYTDDRHHLRVDIQTKQCEVPPDERARLQRELEPLAEAVADFASADLYLEFIHHPRSGQYHVEARLKLPGRTLQTGERDAYLDSAFGRCVRKLVNRVNAYKAHPDEEAVERAGRLAELDREVVAPEDPTDGVAGQAVRDGDYAAFRNALLRYEDWIRLRVGRWVQRYPEAEAHVGRDLRIGDLVEEVYLNAFEQFPRKPQEVSLTTWLDGLLDPSLKAFLRHPGEEAENASMARTVREGLPGAR